MSNNLRVNEEPFMEGLEKQESIYQQACIAASKSLRLHLGCGPVRLPGWTNVDRRYMPSVDVVSDIGILRGVAQDGAVDEIYACHCLDHFTRWEYPRVLRRWWELLKPGGMLRISVPDFEAIVAVYSESNDIRKLQGLLCAAQDYEDNVRHSIWDFRMLGDDLRAAGFENVHRYDWRTTDHAHIDDCSQAYWPHMQKETGRLMSLNVAAFKP